jgi:hypothetical protein
MLTLKVNDRISFSSLKKPAAVPPWRGAQLERPEPPPAPDAFQPAPPTGLSKVFAKSRYEQAFEEGRVRYEGAVQEHAARERQRTMALERSRAEWRAAAEAANAEARRQHAEACVPQVRIGFVTRSGVGLQVTVPVLVTGN